MKIGAILRKRLSVAASGDWCACVKGLLSYNHLGRVMSLAVMGDDNVDALMRGGAAVSGQVVVARGCWCGGFDVIDGYDDAIFGHLKGIDHKL